MLDFILGEGIVIEKYPKGDNKNPAVQNMKGQGLVKYIRDIILAISSICS